MQSKTQNQTKPKADQTPATPKVQENTLPVPQISPEAILQRAQLDPGSLTPVDVQQLQRTIGNQAVGRLLNIQPLSPPPAGAIPAMPAPPPSLQAVIQRRELDIPGYGHVNTNRMTENELGKLFKKLQQENCDPNILKSLKEAYESQEYLPEKKLSTEEKSQVTNTLKDPQLIESSGQIVSTLPKEAEENYKAALLEGMTKLIKLHFREAEKSQKRPDEDINVYVDISRAATIMIKEAIGLQGSDNPALNIIPQRKVPITEKTALQMLWYLISDDPEMNKVHKHFKATKDAEREDLIIGQVMEAFVSKEENLRKLHLIDQEWQASEIKGEIRIQTAYSPKQNLEKKHWDALPVMIHEVLHGMTHPNYMRLGENYATALGRDTLVEGTTDLFKNYVIEYWYKDDKIKARKDIIKLITGNPNANVRKIKSDNYKSMKQANDILSIVSMGNLIEAYFNGNTDLLGLKSPPVDLEIMDLDETVNKDPENIDVTQYMKKLDGDFRHLVIYPLVSEQKWAVLGAIQKQLMSHKHSKAKEYYDEIAWQERMARKDKEQVLSKEKQQAPSKPSGSTSANPLMKLEQLRESWRQATGEKGNPPSWSDFYDGLASTLNPPPHLKLSQEQILEDQNRILQNAKNKWNV